MKKYKITSLFLILFLLPLQVSALTLPELHYRVRYDQIDAIQASAKSGTLQPLINQAGAFGKTTIHLATSPQMLTLLLKSGANPSVTTAFGDPILLHMVQRERQEMVKILLHYGADPDQANHFGNTPLDEATGRNDSEMVKILLPYRR